MGILFILFGLFALLAPQAAWWLEIGWQLKDAEPSDAALLMNRVSGVILIIVGLYMLFT